MTQQSSDRRNPGRTGSCYSVLPGIPTLLPCSPGRHEASDDC